MADGSLLGSSSRVGSSCSGDPGQRLADRQECRIRTDTPDERQAPLQKRPSLHIIRYCGMRTVDDSGVFVHQVHQAQFERRGLIEHAEQPDVVRARPMGAPLPPANCLPVDPGHRLPHSVSQAVKMVDDIVQGPAALEAPLPKLHHSHHV